MGRREKKEVRWSIEERERRGEGRGKCKEVKKGDMRRGEGKGRREGEKRRERKRLLHLFFWFVLNRAAHFIEKELQLFVGKVDTQLLKAIVVKFLKAKNIQNACKYKRRNLMERGKGRTKRVRGKGREGGRYM